MSGIIHISAWHQRVLSRWEPVFQNSMCGVFASSGWSKSIIEETIQYLHDISIRDEIIISKIWDEPQIQAVLADSVIDGNQQVKRIRQFLWHRRYPQLATWIEAQGVAVGKISSTEYE